MLWHFAWGAPRAGMLMFGCVSTNSPTVVSSVNPCTPLPTDRTSMVAEEYKAYAAATSRVPGCRASLALGPAHMRAHRGHVQDFALLRKVGCTH